MIRHTVVISEVRFYSAETDDAFAPYCAICTLVWENPTTVWMRGLHGDLRRTQMVEMAEWMQNAGIKTVKAVRHPRHVLPLAHEVGDHLELYPAEWLARFARLQGNDSTMPLGTGTNQECA